MLSEPVCLRVKGPFACFTRPEFHVERVSYPVITPSAARGILEAILMKPIEKPESAKRDNKAGFRWHILRLGIVRKGTLVSILRNELGYEGHAAYANARGFDIMDERTQRHSLVLKDVEYLIEACIEVDDGVGLHGQRRDERRWNTVQVLAKYDQMFRRRAAAGQCCYQPFLGCREFSVAQWEMVSSAPENIPNAQPEEDFGFVFRDFDFNPVWGRWGHERGRSLPQDGWSLPGNRPLQLPAVRAKAMNGWIRVGEVRRGKVTPV
jgi:CRISPR-associated protein Cas5d